MDLAEDKVYIIPGQTQDLTPPSTSDEHQMQQQPPFERLLLGSLQNGSDLILLKVVCMSFIDLRWLGFVRRVIGDKELLLCLAQDHVDEGMMLPHSLGR